MKYEQDIYNYISSQETNFEFPIQVIDDWDWNMKEHIKTAILYKNSTYKTGKNDEKPFKNIVRPLLNIQYRTEGFDVKDIVMYVDNKKDFYKSFLVKKYHEKWAREHDMDSFIDAMVESYVDFGGVLVKKTAEAVPEVVNMASLAFADQTDIMSGPICIKHYFSPAQLLDMADAGWGEENNGANITLQELIVLATEQGTGGKQKDRLEGRVSETPGQYIEVYEIHGNLPKSYLEEGADEYEYVNQMQIVAFYSGVDGRKGVTLFAAEEKESPFKLLLRDAIHGRGLGLGGVEELEESQVWTNYDIIRLKEMLDSAAKTLFQTTDAAFKNRNKLTDLDNNEILVTEESGIRQIDTFPRNAALFDKSIQDWEAHAMQMAAGNEVALGEQPKSGTPFRLQALITQQANSMHKYRQGKIATFLDEIYKDWIIPYILRELNKDQEFLAELDLKEMQEVAKRIGESKANNMIKKLILSGQMIEPEQVEFLKQSAIEAFKRDGNKKMLKVIDGDIKDVSLSIKLNIAGKQDYLAERVDKLVNVFRQILVAPQILAQAPMADIFNQILEGSGLSPVDFSSLKDLAPQQPSQPTLQTAPTPEPTQ